MSGVSVVIPARDGERYLAEAIDSVLVQEPPVLEVIVVDDGSTDGTAGVARAAGVRCLRIEPSGIGAARNAGIAATAGSLLAFLDADDLWTPRKVEAQTRALRDDPSLEAVFGVVEEFVDGAPDGVRLPRERSEGPAPGSLMVRRSAFERVGPFATDVTLSEWIDWYARARDMGLRMRSLPDVVMRRRIHGENHGLRHAERRSDYLQALKASLDRRRARARR